MTSAIMGMVEQLKGAKDTSLDYTSLANGIPAYPLQEWEGEGDSFGDTLGVILGMNLFSAFEYITAYLNL